jgi:hypothetical protein
MPVDFRSRFLGALACCAIGLLTPISSQASSCQFRLAESTANQLVSDSTICSERWFEFSPPAIVEFRNLSSWGATMPYPRAEAGTAQPDPASQPVENYGLQTVIVAVALVGALRKYLLSPAYEKFWDQMYGPLNWS